MPRRLLYQDKILEALRNGPLSFGELEGIVKTEEGNPVRPNVLANNLSVLKKTQDVEIVPGCDPKHPRYRITFDKLDKMNKDEIARFVQESKNPLAMNSDFALYVSLEEQSNDLDFNGPSFSRLKQRFGNPDRYGAFKHRLIPNPSDVIENLLRHRIADQMDDILTEYAKLVFLGYYSETDYNVLNRKDLIIHEDEGSPLGNKSVYVNILIPEGSKILTAEDLYRKLSDSLSDDYLLWRVFGYLFDRGTTLAGFQRSKSVDGVMRDMMNKGLFRLFSEQLNRSSKFDIGPWKYEELLNYFRAVNLKCSMRNNLLV